MLSKNYFFSLLCVCLFAPCVLGMLDECVAWRLLLGVGWQKKTLLRPEYRSGSADIGCAVLSVAAVLFAPSIKRTQQLNEALADVAQLGYGVESAYGCGLVVTYCQLCGFDFQSLVLDEIADESQFFNVFGCV